MNNAYESVVRVESRSKPGVILTVARMSFSRRLELMRQIRDIASRLEFDQAGTGSLDQMDASILKIEIDKTYLAWGLKAVEGLELDGRQATPQMLLESGPECLVQEALEAVRAQAGLSEAERKN